MKSGLVLLGVAMFVIGLGALYLGILAMAAEPCFIGEACTPGISGNIVGFPVGLALVILGSISWNVGATRVGGETRNPLAQVGFFTIFGLSFLGLGLVMLIADRQPGVDHTTNVLTILGVMFSIVGLGSIGADFLLGRSGARDARVLATGIRGRATVLSVRDTGVTVNMNPMIALDLRVEMPGQPVFTKTVRRVISRLDVGRYRPGLVLSVAADPAQPQSIVVDWDRSPIADTTAATDPVTGQPLAAGVPAIAGSPAVTVGGTPMPAADVAAILRAAADQIAAGGTVAHPGVASAVADVHGGQQLTPDQIATILRTAATHASTATVTTGSTGSTDLAAMLRNASAAAARAADAAESASHPTSG